MLVGCFSVLFTIVDCAAQLSADVDLVPGSVSWLRVALMAIGSALVAWLWLSVTDLLGTTGVAGVDSRINVYREGGSRRERGPKDVQLPLAMFVGAVLAWGAMFLHYWPMASMNDTVWILNDPVGASVQHPLAYNLGLYTIVRIGSAVGGTPLSGVVAAGATQMALWVFVMVLLVRYLVRIGLSRCAVWILTIYCVASPVVGNYTFALVKDGVFSLFVVCAVPLVLHLWQTKGSALLNPGFLLIGVVTLAGLAVTRNNGLIALLVIAPVVVSISVRQRRRALLLIGLSGLLALIPVQVSRVLAAPHKFVESVGVPLQMVGYAIATDPGCLADEDRIYFENLMPLQTWATTYSPVSVDPVKDSGAFDVDFLGQGRRAFVEHWLSAASSCPEQFFRGYVSQTSNLWRVDSSPVGSSGQSVFTSVVSNYPSGRDGIIADYAAKGIVNSSQLPSRLDHVLGHYYGFVTDWMPGAGSWFWMMLLTVLGFVYQRRGEWLAVFTPSLVVWLTLLAGAPTAFPFRYVQFVVVTVPLGVALLLGHRR